MTDLQFWRNQYADYGSGARRLIDALEAEVKQLTAALQEEQGESLRQAEIARDALAEVERLRIDRDYHRNTAEARIKAVTSAHLREDKKQAEVEALQARVAELTEALTNLGADLASDIEDEAHEMGVRLSATIDDAVREALAAVGAEGEQP